MFHTTPGGHARPRPLGNRQRAQDAAERAAEQGVAVTDVNTSNTNIPAPPDAPEDPIDVAARFQATVNAATQQVQAAAVAASGPPSQPMPAYTPTGPQAAVSASAAAAAPPVQRSAVGWLHRDLSAAGSALQHAWPIVRAIAANPKVDELVEAALAAADAGVATAVYQAAIDALDASSARASATTAAAAAMTQAAGTDPAGQPAGA